MTMVFAETIVEKILECNPEICDLNLVSTLEKSYGSPHATIVHDILGSKHADILTVIEEVRACANLWSMPFSVAALNLALQNNICLTTHGAQALTRHNKMAVTSIVTPLEWASFFKKILRESSANPMIALSSRVKMANGAFAHIPMLDLGCKNDTSGLNSALSALRSLSVPGFLLNSGKSFHFYGKKIFSFEEFSVFLGKSILLSPIIDAPWIAHQLIEGAAALRLSAKGNYPCRPYLVCEI